MDALAEKFLGGAEERAGEDDDRGGTVSSLNVLRGREVDELGMCAWSARGRRSGDGRALTMRAAGCITAMCLRIVAPSFVMMTSPCSYIASQ